MAAGDIAGFTDKPGGTFKIGGIEYRVQNAGRGYSLDKINDRTLRFEIRPGDPGVPDDGDHKDRSEIRTVRTFGKDKVVRISYNMMIEPGATISTEWNVLGQWLPVDPQDVGAIPPTAFQMYTGDLPTVNYRYGTPPENVIKAGSWRPGVPVSRGVWHSISFKTRFRRDAEGMLLFSYDGVKVIDYRGPFGYDRDMYWKIGLYRNRAPETLAVTIRNLDLAA